MLVELDTLEIGDEILIPVMNELRRAVLKSRPRINPKKAWGKWASVKVDILNEKDLKDTTPLRTMYQNLEWKHIWLIKKA